MTKIDFKQIFVPQELSGKTVAVMDIREGLGNIIYKYGQGIACHSLALKIYNSKGEMELEDNEVELLMQLVEQLCTPAIADGIKAALGMGDDEQGKTGKEE